jgi:DNA-binding response OmpR family regulator
MESLLRSDIVFVGGDREQFLSLLRRLRAADSTLPIIVVSRLPETSEWLDVLDAGATDYCVPPFDVRQIRSLIGSGANGAGICDGAQNRSA